MGNDIDNEAKIKGSPDSITLEQIKNIYHQMNNCVCNIILGNSTGTGFFCKIPFPDQNNLLPALVTVNHVLDISKHKKVEFHLNGLYHSILIDNSRKIYSSKHYDSTIIEIKKNELNTNYFLDIDENIYQNNLESLYIEKPVYILHYEMGKKLSSSLGKITGVKFAGIDNYRIMYTCSTEHGSSGGPIINSSNFKVIGIHKGYKKHINLNTGIFIRTPIKFFYNANKNNNNSKPLPNSKNDKANFYENKENEKEEYDGEEYEKGDNEEGEYEEGENEDGENEEDEYEEGGNNININQINGENEINEEQKEDQEEIEPSQIHEHPFNVYDSLNELCNICLNKIDNIPGYKCDYCKIILCLDCGDKIIHGKRNENLHNHILTLKKRSNWICNICYLEHYSNKNFSFFCELCNFDACDHCYLNKTNGIIRPIVEADYTIHKDSFYYKNNLNEQCRFCTKFINNMPGYKCYNCPIVLCINCSEAIFISKNSDNLHEHHLELEFRENWICDLCKSKFRNTASFYCQDCQFDACYECYFEN